MAIDYVLLTDTFGHWVITTNEIIDAINTQISPEMLQNLLTTDKTSLVAAINELFNNKYDKTGGPITGNVDVTGNVNVQGTLSVGKNTGGNATIQFFDDADNVPRDMIWDASSQSFKVEDRNGVLQNMFHSGMNINMGTFANLVGDTQLQFKGGTTAENDAYIGAINEITVDIQEGALRLHDGITPGGIVISGGGGTGDVTRYLSGVDFTAGVSNNLTLVNPPDDISLLKVFFNGIRQGRPDLLSLTGASLVFTATIPVGVTAIDVEVY